MADAVKDDVIRDLAPFYNKPPKGGAIGTGGARDYSTGIGSTERKPFKKIVNITVEDPRSKKKKDFNVDKDILKSEMKYFEKYL